MKNCVGTLIIVIIITLAYASVGQTLEFRRDKKELIIYKKYSATFKLKNGNSYKGFVDTLTEKEIFLKTIAGNAQTIIFDEIIGVKKCSYLLMWGARGHFGRYCKKTNLTGYKYKFKPKKK